MVSLGCESGGLVAWHSGTGLTPSLTEYGTRGCVTSGIAKNGPCQRPLYAENGRGITYQQANRFNELQRPIRSIEVGVSRLSSPCAMSSSPCGMSSSWRRGIGRQMARRRRQCSQELESGGRRGIELSARRGKALSPAVSEHRTTGRNNHDRWNFMPERVRECGDRPVVCQQAPDATPTSSVVVDVVERPSVFADEEDYVKAGGSDWELVKMQIAKTTDQPKITSTLKPLDSDPNMLDLVVVGCGPAGLALAAEAGKEGLTVGLIGPDVPFVNNYGVWFDEFQMLGLEDCIEQVWDDSAIYLEDKSRVLLGRKYGRVGRNLLRQELLRRCAENGVKYMDSEVENVKEMQDGGSTLSCTNGANVQCRLAVIAAGAAAGKFLTYEAGVPAVCVQTAYGIEVEVESSSFDHNLMHFMDYRDYKSRADEPVTSSGKARTVENEVPTFLYVMPVTKTRLFLEETCLAARPAMTFSELKERLRCRIETLGIKVLQVYEEEWSYIPVGGALPVNTQQQLAFGAAASMIHPATGYSIVRSLSEAPRFAKEIASSLRSVAPSRNLRNAAFSAWGGLWSRERRRQRAFFLFGLELLVQMDLYTIRDFFTTFFRLPEWLWRGFLSSSLSSIDLVAFALGMFIYGSNSMRSRLVRHLLKDPSGAYAVRVYLGWDESSRASTSSPRSLVALALLLGSAAANSAERGSLPPS